MAQMSETESEETCASDNHIGHETKDDDVTVTTYATNAKVHTVWILIKGYTERTRLKHALAADKGLPKGAPGVASPRPVAMAVEPQLMHQAESMYSDKSSSSQSSSSSQVAKIKSYPFYLPELNNDIQKVCDKIANTQGQHHCYMKIDIGHDSKAFTKQKLCKLIQQACQYASRYGQRLIVYYTGHGQVYTGNWILHPFAPMRLHTDNDDDITDDIDEADEKENRQKIERYPDSFISVDEVFKAMACAFSTESMTEARIIADCCYSHLWVMRIDDFRKDLTEYESNTELHLLSAAAPPKYGGNVLAEDGVFAKFLVEETMKGSCFHAKCDKDHESWMMLWVDGAMRHIRRKSLFSLQLSGGVDDMDDGVDSVSPQDSTANDSGDADGTAALLLHEADVVVVTQKVKMTKLQQLHNEQIAQQQVPTNSLWHQQSD